MKKKLFFSFFFSCLITLAVIKGRSLKVSTRAPAQNTISAQNRGWRITLLDEFSSPEVAQQEASEHGLAFDMNCYKEKGPICEYPFWSKRICDQWKANNQTVRENLADLNKCRWRIYNKYNWMDFDIAEGKGVNSFHESQVIVKDGKLHLKASKNPEWVYKKSCKEKMWSGSYSNYTIDCPIISGGIESHPWGNHNESNDTWEFGFEQAYGRWIVRAKLPDGPGIWPGLWMLPMWSNPNPDPVERTGGKTNCGWPYNGEIDILETWSDAPNEAHQGYIHGDCGKEYDIRQGFTTKDFDLVHEFHDYGMEWGENYIKFFVDNEVTGTIWRGDKLKTKYRTGDKKDKRKRPGEEAWIPSYPFHWILNLSIEGQKGDPKLVPNYDTWITKEVVIDSVKVWRRCSQEEFDDDEGKLPQDKRCEHFNTDKSNSADVYQSTRNETASASMMAYPNPYKMGGGPITVEFRLFQDCKDVKIDLVNVLGQIVQSGQVNMTSENSDIKPKTNYLHDGPLRGAMNDYNSLYQFQFTPNPSLASAMYMIRAEYKQCAIHTRYGVEYTGHGNYVWKEVILK